MREAIITAVVVIAAATAIFAPTAAAAPTPPTEPPYAGCSDWSLSYPMSFDDPQWVFGCEEGSVDENLVGTWIGNYYYWRAESAEVRWYAISMISDGWFWWCNLYPDGIGMCNA